MRWFARAVDVDIGTLSALTVECKRCGRRVAVDGRLPKPGIRCPGCGFTFRISPNSRRASSGLVAAPAGEKTSAPPAWPSRVVELKRHPREEPSPGPPPAEKRPQSTGKAASNRSQAAWLTDESFRTLRTNLMIRLPEGSRLFLVTSSRPQEGKSTVAVNLGCSLLAVGKTVLLVDADLRRPTLHRFFGTSNEVGLTDVLAGRMRLADVCQQFPSGPMVLTSGRIPEDPQELLASAALERTLAELKSEFDFVIIDSAPYLAVADASLIAPRVDGVILVLRYGLVTESEAIRTKRRLESAGSRIVGAVFNCLENSAPDTYHPYSSQYALRDDMSRSPR